MEHMRTEKAFKYLNEVRFMTLSNWSVGAILSDKVFYKDGFKLEPIGNLILRNRDKEILEDDKAYKQVTIKLYGKGVIQRGDELIFGKDIGTKNQFRISEGQFIMSKIDARNGAFGIVPAELEGAITTQDFLSYNINIEKILPEFFNLITGTKHFAELCQKASSGTTGRQRVDEKAFLAFRIPVPSLKIQNDIVQDFKNLHSLSQNQLNEVENLKSQKDNFLKNSLGIDYELKNEHSNGKLNIVKFSSMREWDSFFTTGRRKQVKISKLFPSVRLDEIARITMGISPNSSYFSNTEGLPFIGGASELNDGQISATRFHKKPSATSTNGDIILCVRATIGKIVWSDKDYCLGRGVSAITVISDSVIPEFLFEMLDYLEDDLQRFGTGSTFKQVSKSTIQSLLIPLPPLDIQQKLLNQLKEIKDSIKEMLNQAEKNRETSYKNFESSIFNID
ncbi:restriction endonuclease subunit S [Algoriphagus sp. CAU 1675]|uniref:restriction endonuclease subunit S n=1 Tax=Algoriphagus sp. CAU 1675 TaxID=3032597 RepID=UPI0023DAC605|nr:restriction endonuclease subunit S [Algoriphagus sp. CAU 1675]MDF2157889.1 restriction endonuclease subunit S [Algoriphagus sp. CAU 1675]